LVNADLVLLINHEVKEQFTGKKEDLNTLFSTYDIIYIEINSKQTKN